MKFAQVATALLSSSLVLAAPAPALIAEPDKTLKARATQICGQWSSVVTGAYTVYQDLWGEAAATSGSQCSTVDSLTSGVIVWSTAWTWLGGSSSVKSYANVALTTTGVQLSSISSIPTTWKYRFVDTLYARWFMTKVLVAILAPQSSPMCLTTCSLALPQLVVMSSKSWCGSQRLEGLVLSLPQDLQSLHQPSTV